MLPELGLRSVNRKLGWRLSAVAPTVPPGFPSSLESCFHSDKRPLHTSSVSQANKLCTLPNVKEPNNIGLHLSKVLVDQPADQEACPAHTHIHAKPATDAFPAASASVAHHRYLCQEARHNTPPPGYTRASVVKVPAHPLEL